MADNTALAAGTTRETAIAASANPLKDYLTGPKALEALRAVATKTITPDRLVRIALSVAARQPELGKCTPQSILQSLMQSAELGLEVGTLGHAYLVPFKRSFKNKSGGWESVMEAQFIPGYRGLISLAHRSGEIAKIYAHAVYDGDDFNVELGDTPSIRHHPDFDSPRGDENVKGFYAVVQYKTGVTDFEYMPKSDVDAIKAKSKGAFDRDGKPNAKSPWFEHYGEMGKKTAIRRLAKRLPLSPESPFGRAIQVDEDNDREDGFIDTTFTRAEVSERMAALPAGTTSTRAPRATGKTIDVVPESDPLAPPPEPPDSWGEPEPEAPKPVAPPPPAEKPKPASRKAAEKPAPAPTPTPAPPVAEEDEAPPFDADGPPRGELDLALGAGTEEKPRPKLPTAAELTAGLKAAKGKDPQSRLAITTNFIRSSMAEYQKTDPDYRVTAFLGAYGVEGITSMSDFKDAGGDAKCLALLVAVLAHPNGDSHRLCGMLGVLGAE